MLLASGNLDFVEDVLMYVYACVCVCILYVCDGGGVREPAERLKAEWPVGCSVSRSVGWRLPLFTLPPW